MRRLHPDKAGGVFEAAKAADLAREARDACERRLSREEPPCSPQHMRFEALSLTPKHRRFRIHWSAPPSRGLAPVRRYVVAALDPAYGKALTIAILEPDYSEELRRFVPLEEITSYVLAEEDLVKMPMLWEQPHAQIQVAAANDAGQSPWSTVHLPLNVMSACASAAPRAAPKRSVAQPAHVDDLFLDDSMFRDEVMKRRGRDLREFLEVQTKFALLSFLKSTRWPTVGTKEELVNRIIYCIEGQVRQ